MSNLKRARKAKGLSQCEIAKLLGITQATFSGWENEKYEIDKISLLKLTEILNVTTDYLLGLTNVSSTPTEKSVIETIYEQLNDLGKEKAEAYIMDLLDNPKYTCQEELPAVPSLEEAMRLQKGTPLRTDRLGHDNIVHKAAFGGGVWDEKEEK